MDPGTLAMLASVIIPMIGGMGGKDEKFGSTYNQGQQSGINDLLQKIKGMGNQTDITQGQNYGQGQEWLQGLFNDPQFFQNMEAPAMRQFNEEIIPGVANRFASMGSGGALGSTGFRNQLGRESSNLATNLAANRGQMQQAGVNQSLQYGQQPFSNLMSLYGQAMQPTNNQYQAAQPGFFGNVAGSFAGGAAQGFGNKWGQNMAGQSPLTQ